MELEQPCLSVVTTVYHLEQNYLFKWTGFLTDWGQLGQQVGVWIVTAQLELGVKFYLATFEKAIG